MSKATFERVEIGWIATQHGAKVFYNENANNNNCMIDAGRMTLVLHPIRGYGGGEKMIIMLFCWKFIGAIQHSAW